MILHKELFWDDCRKHGHLKWEVGAHADVLRRADTVDAIGPGSLGSTLEMTGDLKNVEWPSPFSWMLMWAFLPVYDEGLFTIFLNLFIC